MAANKFTLFGYIKMNTTGMQAGMAKAKGTLKKFGKDVGGATKELRLMGAVSGGMGGKLGLATTAMTSFIGILRAATVAAGSLSIALWPITLVVAAIALVLGPLIVYFTESQEGMDKMSVAAAEVSATFDVLLDRVMTFGEAMYDIFFEKDYVSGWEKMKKAMLGIAKEIEDEASAAGRLAEALLSITRLENQQILRRAKAKTMIKAFNKDADDRTKTYEERALAARAAIKVEQQLAKEEIALLKERLQKEGLQIESKEEFNKIYKEILEKGKIELDQIGLSNTKELDRKAIYEDVAAIYTRNTESIKLQTKLNNKLNQIEEEKQRAIDKTNTEIQKGIDKRQKELDLQDKIKTKELESISSGADSIDVDPTNELSIKDPVVETTFYSVYKDAIVRDAAELASTQEQLMNDKFTYDSENALFQIEQDTLNAEQIAENKKALEDEQLQRQEAFNNLIQSALASSFVAIGETIGNALSGTANAMEGGFNRILLIMAEFAGTFGKQLIAFGVSGIAIKLFSGNPVLAIIAGTALVALSKLATNTLNKGMTETTGKFASGGIVGGTSFTGDKIPISVNSGEMILNRKQQAGLFGGGGSSVINVQGILRGEDIYLSNLESSRIQNNTL